MKKVVLDLLEELDKEIDRSGYSNLKNLCYQMKTEANKLEDDNKKGKYVMVIEDYSDEDYMYGVRFKSSILDYKNYYMAHTDELNEEELAKLINCSFYARWYAIINLENMEFINDEIENIIYSKWKDKLPEPDEDFFWNSFHYSSIVD